MGTDSDGADGVPVQIVAQFLGEGQTRGGLFGVLTVEPAAPRRVTGSPGGVPDARFGFVAGDFVLVAAQQPGGVDFFGAEVKGAVAAVDDVGDLRGEVVVVKIRDDQAVALLVLGVVAPKNLFAVFFR